MHEDTIIQNFLDSLLSQTHAGYLMDRHPLSLSRMRREGRGPRFYRIGQQVFYTEKDIKAWWKAGNK